MSLTMPFQAGFYKLEALSNDFVLIDARVGGPAILQPEQITALADRRSGIGFDQMLVLRHGSADTVAAVDIFNADGSRAEQCGNGMRAIAAWLDRAGQLAPGTRVATPAGPVSLAHAAQGGFSAELPGPEPLTPSSLALAPPSLPAGALGWHLISLGNPHLIVHWPTQIRANTLAELVSAVEQDRAWRQRTNIGVLHIESADSVALRVHERGVGPTRACGSAACAAAWATRKQHPGTAPVSVRQPGGTLVVDLHARAGRAVTTGPASVVFEGRLA